MQNIQSIKQDLAKLLRQLSYREGDFTLASGRHSDYYFDCRVTALNARGSWLIGQMFNHLLKGHDIKGVGGMSMGADPLVTATTVISHQLAHPLHGLLVRKEAKSHGTGQYVEGMGNFQAGDRIAVLEDVITTGGSVLKACERLCSAGLTIDCICVILDREEGGRQTLEAQGYKVHALFTRNELLEFSRSE